MAMVTVAGLADQGRLALVAATSAAAVMRVAVICASCDQPIPAPPPGKLMQKGAVYRALG